MTRRIGRHGLGMMRRSPCTCRPELA